MVLLSQEADKGDPTAIGLHSQLSSYKFLALLHLTADILGISNHLSRIFQYKDVSFSVLRHTVSIAMCTITAMETLLSYIYIKSAIMPN